MWWVGLLTSRKMPLNKNKEYHHFRYHKATLHGRTGVQTCSLDHSSFISSTSWTLLATVLADRLFLHNSLWSLSLKDVLNKFMRLTDEYLSNALPTSFYHEFFHWNWAHCFNVLLRFQWAGKNGIKTCFVMKTANAYERHLKGEIIRKN